ncbi:hypothetical protein [Chitinasiproducens palmae]|nr:hypothetical protein [Chitinasiproducens palmae]
MQISKLFDAHQHEPVVLSQRRAGIRRNVAAFALAAVCTSAWAVTPVTNQPGPHATGEEFTTNAPPNATGMGQTSSTTDPDASRTLSTAAQRGSEVPTASTVSNGNSTSTTAIHEGSEKPAKQASGRGGKKRSKHAGKTSDGAGGFQNGLYGTGAGGSD